MSWRGKEKKKPYSQLQSAHSFSRLEPETRRDAWGSGGEEEQLWADSPHQDNRNSPHTWVLSHYLPCEHTVFIYNEIITRQLFQFYSDFNISWKKKIAYKRVCDANSIRRAVDGELFKCKPEQRGKKSFQRGFIKPSSPVMVFPVNVLKCPEVRGNAQLTEDRAVDRIKNQECFSLALKPGRARVSCRAGSTGIRWVVEPRAGTHLAQPARPVWQEQSGVSS